MPEKKDERGWKKMLAGSLAGSTSVTLTYPFDIMRARLAYHLSTHPEFSHSSSLATPGALPFQAAPSSVALWRRLLFGKTGKRAAGLPGGLATFRQLLTHVPAQEGSRSASNHPKVRALRGLYRGYLPTLLGIVPYAGVSFASYEGLKALALYSYYGHSEGATGTSTLPAPSGPSPSSTSSSPPPPTTTLPGPIRFVCGLVAGALGQTCSYPLDVVRRRMQLDSLAAHLPRYPGFWAALRHAAQDRGGLFLGLSINYLKVAPATAISFVTYEYLKDILHIV
jgi:hypothetical protein